MISSSGKPTGSSMIDQDYDGRPRLQARGVVEEAAIAIATTVGRRIASVTVASTQEARLATSTNCWED